MIDRLEPAPTADRWIDVEGGVLRCRDDGPRTAAPVVLVHELGGSLESWDGVVELLDGHVRTLRFDQRGAGRSFSPVAPFGLDDLVDDLCAVLAAHEVDQPVHLVGAAFGATQAIALTARHPQIVASLTLLAPALSVGPESRTLMHRRAADAVRIGMAGVEGASLDRAWPPERRHDVALFAAHRGRYLANDPVAWARHHEAMTESDVRDDLAGLDVSTLVLAGCHDTVRPPDQLRAELAGRSRTSIAEVDAAHFMAIEAPHLVTDHLARHLAGATAPGPHHRTARPVHRDGDPLDATQRAAVQEAVDGTRGRIPAPMRAWIASPEFARRAQALGETLRYHTSLPARLSELAILTTARIWRSDHEWRAHIGPARDAGLEEVVIEALRRGRRPLDLAPDEELVLDVCVALHCSRDLPDDVHARAVAGLGPTALAELVGILGYYSLVSMTLNAYRIGVDDAPTPFTTADPEVP